MKTEEFQFASNTGVCEIFGKIYTPNENVKAVVRSEEHTSDPVTP